MELFNPFGKDAADSSVSPRACMCNVYQTLNTALGSDSCVWCGCICGGDRYRAGNAKIAIATIRKT